MLIPKKPSGWLFKILFDITSDPWLLKPSLLISALSSFNLKILGFLLPYWGLGVTAPISTIPTPKLNIPLMASPFLSNPAATPIGFLIFTLKKEVFKNSNFFWKKL